MVPSHLLSYELLRSEKSHSKTQKDKRKMGAAVMQLSALLEYRGVAQKHMKNGLLRKDSVTIEKPLLTLQ